MRILIANSTASATGGTERAIEMLTAGLAERDHNIAFVEEAPVPGFRRIALGERARCWTLRDDTDRVLDEIARSVAPELVWVHGVRSLGLEERLLERWPAVVSVHDYRGLCISGQKSFANERPCSRRFGAECLALYLPMRCGGRSPVTMTREYGVQRSRLELLRRYRERIVHSEHMRSELARQGLSSSVIDLAPVVGDVPVGRAGRSPGPMQFLVVARLERNKGAHIAIEALASLARSRAVELTIVGDGRERTALEELAARHATLRVRFAGWLDPDALDEEYRRADYLLVPSTWPEPFGLVGLEAARHGVPAVAFDVGGIRSWLRDGDNGVMASGAPSSIALLAAIERAISIGREVLGSSARRRCAEFRAFDSVARAEEILSSATRPRWAGLTLQATTEESR